MPSANAEGYAAHTGREARIWEAGERVDVYCRDVHEEREAKRAKRDKIVEQASSSQEVPSYVSVEPGGGEEQELETDEERKAKRVNDYEHVEDHAERAKRMEEHDDDDEDMLMELA